MRPTASFPFKSKVGFRPCYDSLLNLTHRETRDETGLYFVEGFRFAHQALRNPEKIVAVAWRPEVAKAYSARSIAEQLTKFPQFEISQRQISNLGFSPEPQGVVLVLRQDRIALDRVETVGRGAWIGMESLRTTGNVGTILRSMAASASPGLFLFSNRGEYLDVYEPSVLRASMGAQLNMRIIHTTYRDFARWTFRPEFRVLGAEPNGALDYRRVSYRRPILLMIGHERSGLSPGQAAACDSLIRIPMAKHVDSLNAAMAATLLLFESFNQQ